MRWRLIWKVICRFLHWTLFSHQQYSIFHIPHMPDSAIFHLLHLWSHCVPIHSNTMEFNYLALKPILCAKVSNVNNPIYRNGAVIYLSESYQQNWNLLWNVSHFGAIWRQSFVQNFTICIFLLESNFKDCLSGNMKTFCDFRESWK